jgi:hypothetical protein
LKYFTGNDWQYGPYFVYLESVRRRMPANLYEFASNQHHYDLESPDSLHDSWLRSCNVAEAQAPNTDRHGLRVEICLLGPRHDRLIHLRYENVGAYSFNNPERYQLPPENGGHGDLLVHELLVVGENEFSHEMLFSRGTTLFISFSGFSHRVQGL